MDIFWACIFVFASEVAVIDVAGTPEGCHASSKQNPGSFCFPVNTRDHVEAKLQIESLIAILKP
jgi:hypothetical protein